MKNIIVIIFFTLSANISVAQKFTLNELIRAVNYIEGNDSALDHYLNGKGFQCKEYNNFYERQSLANNNKNEFYAIHINRLIDTTGLICKHGIQFSTDDESNYLSFRQQLKKCGFKYVKTDTFKNDNFVMNRDIISEYRNDDKYLELSLLTSQSVDNGIADESMTKHIIRVLKTVKCLH